MRNDRVALRVLQVLAVYGIVIHTVVGVINLRGDGDLDKRAIVVMGLSLIAIWCILGGITQRLMRDRFVRWSTRLAIGWRVRFVFLCIAMAMIEEAVTTSLTNAGPLLGAETEAARITISTNYFEVIRTSVVAFIPWFIFWSWFLCRYDFKPLEVMLLFGLTGTLAETISFGVDNLAGIGMWTFVYGLMVYLPAHTVPERPEAKRPRWWHWIVAVLFPLIFIIPFAVYAVLWIVISVVSRIRNAGTTQSGTRDRHP